MTTTIKVNEARSPGHIIDKEEKKQQHKTINQQIDEFFKKGGKVKKS